MRFLSTLLASTLGALLAFGVLIFFSFLFLFALAASADTEPSVRTGSVLVMNLEGAVPEVSASDPLLEAFADEGVYDLHDLKNALRRAAVDDRVDALWIQVKGTANGWATLEEIRRAVETFRASGKPVFASSDDYAMNEAAYFVASAADSVYTSPQAFFEFNGFSMTVEFYKRLLDRLEVQPEVVRAGRFKSAVEPYLRTDLSPENEEQLAALLADWNERFMRTVGDARGLDPDLLRSIASERAIITARDAYEAGLLDGLLFRDEVEARIRERLAFEADEDLRTVTLSAYARVSDADAGLDVATSGEIAVVYAVGAIMSGESGTNPLFGEVVGAERFNEAMREAREDEDVRAVVLRVNSPGGSVAAADAMLREVRLTNAVKPVIVSMGDYAASGGYYIAADADTIVANPLTLTGSIGVFSVLFNARGLFEDQIGITFDAVQTSPYADLFSVIQPLSPANRALLQQSTEETYEAFIELVAAGRGLDVSEVDSVGQGRVWTGKQAVEVGLVDVLGGIDTAVDLAAERAGLAAGIHQVRVLPRPRTFIEEFSESLSSRARAAYAGLFATPTERFVAEQARALQHLVDLHATPQALLPARFRIE